jgi:hypothetical protein
MTKIIRRDMGAATAAALAALCGLASTQEPITALNLQGLVPKTTHNIGTLGPSLMGDRDNTFTGARQFLRADVTIPGSNALPAAFWRRSPRAS